VPSQVRRASLHCPGTTGLERVTAAQIRADTALPWVTMDTTAPATERSNPMDLCPASGRDRECSR